jgi:hypothetical protein
MRDASLMADSAYGGVKYFDTVRNTFFVYLRKPQAMPRGFPVARNNQNNNLNSVKIIVLVQKMIKYLNNFFLQYSNSVARK